MDFAIIYAALLAVNATMFILCRRRNRRERQNALMLRALKTWLPPDSWTEADD